MPAKILCLICLIASFKGGTLTYGACSENARRERRKPDMGQATRSARIRERTGGHARAHAQIFKYLI